MNWQPRHTRLLLVAGAVACAGLAVFLVLTGLRENVTYFYSPAMIAEKEAELIASQKSIRLGGLVEKGSVTRHIEEHGGATLSFSVTDGGKRMQVSYTGMPPDLFREEQGVVAEGRVTAPGTFVASTLLAKHDENYMPPEVAKALKTQEMKLRQDMLEKKP